MKVGIIGYGKMGKTIEKILKNRGHVISSVVDVTNEETIKNMAEKGTEVAIEFTTPDSAVSNLKECIDYGIPVVCGTTGWLDSKGEVEKYCKEKSGTFFYASNYSLGVNLFFKLNKKLAEMMNRIDENYKASISEIHHTHKLDKPSGTAITLAEGVLTNLDRYKNWKCDEEGNDDDLTIWSYREPDVPGTHTISYESNFDQIEIKHTAKTREGFALGAVLVAEWINDQKGVLSMDDYLKF